MLEEKTKTKHANETSRSLHRAVCVSRKSMQPVDAVQCVHVPVKPCFVPTSPDRGIFAVCLADASKPSRTPRTNLMLLLTTWYVTSCNIPKPFSCAGRALIFTWWGCYDSCLRREPTELAYSFFFFFLLCSCVCFCLYGPFNCISFHTFSSQLSVFLLCSSGLIFALLVLSTICLFMKVSFSPNIIPNGWLGSKHQLTN